MRPPSTAPTSWLNYAGRPCRKRSSGKQYWPGGKQVFRLHDAAGVMVGDTLAPQSATFPGKALLEPVMRRGMLLGASPTLPQIRRQVCAQVAALPATLRSLNQASPFQLVVPAEMRRLAREVDARQQLLAQRDRARWLTS